MSELQPPNRTRTIRLLVTVIAGAVLLALVVVGVIGLIAGRPDPGHGTPGPSSSPSGTMPPGTDDPAVLTLPATSDPVLYATAVAEALFAWDTNDAVSPDAHRDALMEAAAAPGPERNGLLHDIAGHLPAPESWTELTAMQARQWLEVTAAAIPEGWTEAAEHPSVAPGTVAVTIDGTRHREGVWAGAGTSAARPVAFTLFLSCPPDGDCALLRLTRPNAPLR